MARAQIKLLLFLITLGIMVGCLATAWWIYQNILLRDAAITEDIAQMQAPNRPPPDPGARRFDAAVELISQGKLDEARDALYKLLQQFPKSPTCVEAKRIIGEMNMDALYRLDASGGKKDYIVQPRDALLAIAAKNKTTMEALARINSLTTINLQPGEHLFVIPMDFDLALDVSEKKLTLLRGGRFFKEYLALDLRLPPNTKIPSEMEIGGKSAMVDGKQANPVSADFVRAEKRIIGYKSATTVGLILRTPPAAQPVEPPKPKSDSAKSKGSDDTDDEGPSAVTTGLFLSQEDLEEIYPILRRGSKLSLVQ